ncbi:Eukaryotic aspartyl protease family protein [Striga hermonthica]|uniref:Eukaryotic aspartyl protease family protein n=1 Tax=Striga hermonthica TaxID=68872 RepID=A0A9N7NY67_STRHE|nr:Eukaryotic aspartyl protease family protein [Striga hermonthica]
MEFNFNTMVKHVDHEKHLSKTELLRLALHRSRKRLGDGEYLAYLFIGTPAVPIPVIIDTGSDLTWTQCALCDNCSVQPTPLFDPAKSTSYVALKCPNKKCKLYKSDGCNKRLPGTTCAYNRTYGDGSRSRGDLATETFWFEGVPVPGVLFGCAFHSYGSVVGGGTGILGLGRWDDSIVSQHDVHAFSYCLSTFDSNGTGRLFMGYGARAPPGAATTRLLRYPGALNSGFYYLRLQGITINGVLIPINSSSSFKGRKDGSMETISIEWRNLICIV